MLNTIIEYLSNEIEKKYKINKNEIHNFIFSNLEKKVELKQRWENAETLKDIIRTSDYKNFSKEIKKEIYYHLRTYQIKSDSKDIDSYHHVSTKERQTIVEEFFRKTDKYLTGCKVLIDIGGGMFPITVPSKYYSGLENFVWLDKDKMSYQKIIRFAKDNDIKNLSLFCNNIEDRPWEYYLPEGSNNFDVALMLKLIPVINRQQRDLLGYLSKVPASRIIITGNKESMVKKVSIQNRERDILLKFIKLANKKIVDKLEFSNEFGYVIA